VFWASGQVLGIELLDHIVVGDGHYYSFKEGARL
jgi:DNA repair protein RadC